VAHQVYNWKKYLLDIATNTKARQLSQAERRGMVERVNPVLSISQQCRLLAVPRSSAPEYGQTA
jgi:hypothetical protein